MAVSPYIFDVGNDDFDRQVLENSYHNPVVVYFCSPRVASCMIMRQRLTHLCSEHQGRFLLVEINFDDKSDLAAKLGIRSLPQVRIYRAGEIVAAVRGAESEASLRKTLSQQLRPLLKPLHATALQAYQQGSKDEAMQQLVEAMADAPEDARISADMLRMLMLEQRYDEAEQLALSLPQTLLTDPLLGNLCTHIELINASNASDDKFPKLLMEYYMQLETEPQAIALRLELVSILLKIDDIASALEQLFLIRQHDRSFRNDIGHRGLLAVLSMLNDEGECELVEKYEARILQA